MLHFFKHVLFIAIGEGSFFYGLYCCAPELLMRVDAVVFAPLLKRTVVLQLQVMLAHSCVVLIVTSPKPASSLSSRRNSMWWWCCHLDTPSVVVVLFFLLHDSILTVYVCRTSVWPSAPTPPHKSMWKSNAFIQRRALLLVPQLGFAWKIAGLGWDEMDEEVDLEWATGFGATL